MAPDGTSRVSKNARLAESRRARQRAALRRRIAVSVVVIAALAVATVAVANARRHNQRLASSLTARTCRLDQKADPGRDHARDPTYRVNPPAGGDHVATAAPADVYTLENRPPDGEIVHAMEHGYVVLWYRTGLPKPEVNQVEGVASDYSVDTLVVPRDDLPVPVAATAWGQRLLCQRVEPGPLTSFIKAYRNKGPERIPHT
jgi:hypothetical protein